MVSGCASRTVRLPPSPPPAAAFRAAAAHAMLPADAVLQDLAPAAVTDSSLHNERH